MSPETSRKVDEVIAALIEQTGRVTQPDPMTRGMEAVIAASLLAFALVAIASAARARR